MRVVLGNPTTSGIVQDAHEWIRNQVQERLFEPHQEELANHSRNTHGSVQAKSSPGEARDISRLNHHLVKLEISLGIVCTFCDKSDETSTHVLGQGLPLPIAKLLSRTTR